MRIRPARPLLPRLALALGLVMAGTICLHALPAQAQSEPKPAKPARKSKPALKKPAPAPVKAPTPPPVLPEPPLPVQQAQKLGMTRCLGTLDKMSRDALTSPYDVQSAWNGQAPAEHVFQSIAVLDRPDVTPANGLAAFVAAPVPSGLCDGVAVQVFPLAADCATAQKFMEAQGAKMNTILNTKIMIDRTGKRIVLMPAVKNTCVAVSVDIVFGTPQPAPLAAAPSAQSPIPLPAAPPPVPLPVAQQSPIPLPAPAAQPAAPLSPIPLPAPAAGNTPVTIPDKGMMTVPMGQ